MKRPLLLVVCCLACLAVGCVAGLLLQRHAEPPPPVPPANALKLDLRQRLLAANDFELITVGAREEVPEGRPDEEFHGWPVLGRTGFHRDDWADTRELIDALDESVRTQPRTLATCFVPRHGIRVTLDSETYLDLLICFQCNDMRIFIGDTELAADVHGGGRLPAGHRGAAVFDKIARKHGLHLGKTLAERAAHRDVGRDAR